MNKRREKEIHLINYIKKINAVQQIQLIELI